MRGLVRWLAVLALGLAVAYTFNNTPYFLQFGIQADTLYPALLTEELRADLGAALRFTPSRIPSFVPDLLIAVGIDGLTGSWRLAFWFYGAAAFVLLSAFGGWIGAEISGRRACERAVALALPMALLMFAGLALQLWASGERPMEAFDAKLPVSPHTLLMLPIWHGGGFIIGLAVVALAWRSVCRPGVLLLGFLLLVSAAAVASNTITIAHAVLPAIIAVADAAWRRTIARRAALAAVVVMVLGGLIGVWLGSLSKRMDLPLTPSQGWVEAAQAGILGLSAQPVMLALLLAALPIALAFLWPRRAAAFLPAGGQASALRFFIVVAAAACSAALLVSLALYAGPMSWRYAMPLGWWPVIFAAAFLPKRRLTGLAWVLALGLVAAQGGASPAIMRWQHPATTCLDAADPGFEWRAGLAAYWHARTIAATGDWRRQVESTDFGDARPLLWIADPRSHLQQRHGMPGKPPPYRFLYMAGMDPAAVTAIHGAPERVLPCGDYPIWVFPPGWDPVDRLIAMADPLVPQALAIGRQICIAPARMAAEGLVLELPAGAWRFSTVGAARLRVSDATSGAVLSEVASRAEIRLHRPADIRFSRLNDAPLVSLAISPAGAETQACRLP
jgi:hypothetical protein